MAAHRYWRILLREYGGNGGLGELQMRASLGGANVAVGGVPYASSQLNTSYTPAKAFDGLTVDTGTANAWQASAAAGGGGLGSYPWLAYDFGAGNEKDIAEIVIFAPGASGIAVTTMVTAFDWQYSDNNVTWKTQRSVDMDKQSNPWVYGTSRVFDVRQRGPIDFHNDVALKKIGGQRHYPPGRPGELTYSPSSDEGKICISTTQFWHDPVHGGLFKIAGTATSLGFPVARRVRLYYQMDGRIYAEQYTREDGLFEFKNLDVGPWTVVGIDDTSAQNGVIFSHVNAVPM